MNKPTGSINSHLLTHCGGALAKTGTVLAFTDQVWSLLSQPSDGTVTGRLPSPSPPPPPPVPPLIPEATLPGSPKAVPGEGGLLASGPHLGQEGRAQPSERTGHLTQTGQQKETVKGSDPGPWKGVCLD